MDNLEKDHIHQSIRLARKQLMDLLQACYGHEPSWENVRARVLKILGRTGIEAPFLQTQLNNGNTEYHEDTRKE